MNTFRCSLILLTFTAVGVLTGCASVPAKSADISDGLRHSLDNAGLKNVSVDQDRDKGVVTLGGHVAADSDKAQAESIAQSMAGGQVVSNQIAVVPLGAESATKAINSDLDKGIQSNLDAANIQNNLGKSVGFQVKSGVVTLTGNVNSEAVRAQAADIASRVPNVQQVVNELQVKDQKASSN
jgi:hyperosmotically inducible protein